MSEQSITLEQFKASNFKFSASPISVLGAPNYSLVSIVFDVSGSTAGFANEMTVAMKECLKSLRRSPRAENVLLRVTRFATRYEEVTGFKPLDYVNLDDYDLLYDSSNVGGTTALYDSLDEVITVTKAEADRLIQGGITNVNADIYVISDGENNAGNVTLHALSNAHKQLSADEKLESIKIVLVGVNGVQLQNICQHLPNAHFIDIGQADDKNLAKLAGYISRSVTSTSQQLGTGQGNLKPLTF